MKVNNIIFAILAGASLGLALPSHSTPTNTSLNTPLSPSNTTLPHIPKSTPPNTTESSPASPISPLSAVFPAGKDPTAGLSKECAAALLTIITSPEFLKCVPLTAIIPLTPLIADPTILSKFLADPAKNYSPVEQPLLQCAAVLCPAPKCSDSGVAGAVKAIQDGCKADLPTNKFIQLAYFMAVFYSPLHDSFCFKDGSKFCWDESVLTAIKLPASPIKILGNPVLDAVAVADPPVICTKCNKQIYNTVANFVKGNDLAKQLLAQVGVDDKALNEIVVFFAVKCGIKFEDGNVPKK